MPLVRFEIDDHCGVLKSVLAENIRIKTAHIPAAGRHHGAVQLFEQPVPGTQSPCTELIDPDGCGRLACLQRDFRIALPVCIGVYGDLQRTSLACGDFQPRCAALETPLRIGPHFDNLRLPAIFGKGAYRIAEFDVMLIGFLRAGRATGKRQGCRHRKQDSVKMSFHVNNLVTYRLHAGQYISQETVHPTINRTNIE